MRLSADAQSQACRRLTMVTVGARGNLTIKACLLNDIRKSRSTNRTTRIRPPSEAARSCNSRRAVFRGPRPSEAYRPGTAPDDVRGIPAKTSRKMFAPRIASPRTTP